MKPSPKFLKLLKDLRDATYREKLQWSETDDEDIYRVNFDYIMIRIESGDHSKPEFEFYCASLLTPKGKVIELFPAYPADGEGYELLHELFELARRSALKADDLIERAIADVERMAAPRPVGGNT